MGTVTVLQTPGTFDSLPKRHREFVESYARTGDARRAYLEAGYADTRNTGKKARELRLKLARYITDAVRERATAADMAILGLTTLEELATRGGSEAVRLNAAKELLARALPEEAREVTVNHNHTVRNLTDAELNRRIARLRGDLAIDVTPSET